MQERKVLVVGFTKRTSFYLAKALGKEGYTILISDSVCNNEKVELLQELKNEGLNIINLLGNQDPSIIDNTDVEMLAVSPGVPLNIPLIKYAKEKKIPVIGDIEIFYNMFEENFYIGVTGTDGKTTTTTLIYEICKKERKTHLGGNIGIPIFKLYEEKPKNELIVLELSSFQLEAIERFKPNIALLLNIAEDHLDRYSSMREYIEAKKRIFMNQKKEDTAILNMDSPYFNEIIPSIASKILTFSSKNCQADIYFKDGKIYINGKPFISREEIFIKGIHNVENCMAAILAARVAGISDKSIIETLKEFRGVEHRLEFVREINGIEFYNDSKSTTINSLEKALLSFDGKPIILIAGGRDKGLDFRKVSELIKEKVKHLILIGEASTKMEREINFPNTIKLDTMEDAVMKAYKLASKGDVVLLSPGCTSFDMFRDYEERGRVFKECVKNLN